MLGSSKKIHKKTVPEGLESISLEHIRKYARHSWQFIDVYCKGLTGPRVKQLEPRCKMLHVTPETYVGYKPDIFQVPPVKLVCLLGLQQDFAWLQNGW
nr:2019_t:CDS:2 [Entrophospora candida]